MKNKLIFEGSGLNKKQQQRVLEVLAQTPEDFGFMVADDKYAGIKVWPKFRVESENGHMNKILLVPLLDSENYYVYSSNFAFHYHGNYRSFNVPSEHCSSPGTIPRCNITGFKGDNYSLTVVVPTKNGIRAYDFGLIFSSDKLFPYQSHQQL